MHQKTALDNGLRILTEAMPHARSVSVGFYIGVGSRYEPDAVAGVSHFIEHLLFKGTSKRPTSREISTAIEGVGGILNGGTDKELTAYWCKVAQPHFQIALDVLVDMLLNSRFDPEEMEKERQVIFEEIKMTKDSPAQRVDMLIDQLLWPGHPLGRDIAGDRESVTAVTRGSMLDYMTGHYQPENTVIAVAGNVGHRDIVTAVSQALGGWSNPQPRAGYQAYTERYNPRLLIETRETEQAHLCLALPGLPLLHPRRFVLELLNIILGEGMSSRLFTEIRDKLGLAYHIHSYADYFSDCGSIIIYAGVETGKLAVAVEAILEQLALMKQPVPQSELTKAKELSKGRLLLRMEDSRSVAGWIGGQEILTGRILTVDEVVAIIDEITVAEISELASELLVGSRLRLAVVGPIKSDEPLDNLLKIE